jgi:osmotically-inducible protein OsmY
MEAAMKTDSKLREDVVAELKWDPQIREKEIGIAVKDGVISMSGFVESHSQKFAAERAAERVSGVRAVANDIEVKVQGASERTDTQIAHAALAALDWDEEVPAEKVKVSVEHGWIRLEGSVEWQYQRLACERAVRYLVGVKGVTNMIIVKPMTASPFEVSQKIKDALRRTAEVAAEKITVESHDGRVTLKGSVRSWVDRVDAERAAWAAPGVTSVDDQIAIRP